MKPSSIESDHGCPESEERLLIDTAPTLIHTARPDGFLDFFNRQWLEYLGVPLEEVQGWRWTSAIHPEDVEGIVAKWRASLSTGEPFEAEARVRRADGEYRWFLHRKVPLRNERGNILKWYGSSADIEDRKRKEDALRRSEALLAEAQRLTRIGSFVFKLPHTSEYWSPELFEILGIDPAKGPLPDIAEYMTYVHPDDRERILRETEEFFAKDHDYEYKYRFIRPDGETRVLREVGTPVRDKGIITHFIGAIADITEQEQLTQELRRNEFYLNEGQRLSNSGSWSFTSSGICDYWSPQLYGILGFDPAKGIPTIADYLAIVHPEDRESVAGTIKKMIAEGVGCDVKKRIIRTDGQLRVIRCVGVPVFEAGKASRFIGTLVDVTEQELMTQELRRREAYLAEAQRLSHTGSFGWRACSGEIVWSEETFSIFEYERAIKPTLELVLRRVHPEDKALVQRLIERVSQNGEDFDFEHRLLMPNGSIKHLHVVAHAVNDESGSVEIVGSVMDVTERKQAEEALRKSEEQWRDVFENNPTMYFMVDATGRVVSVNPFGAEQLGYSVGELVNHPVLNVFYEADRPVVQKNFAASLGQLGRLMSWEVRKVRKDGAVIWVREMAKAIERAEGPIVLIACEDITAAKRSQQESEQAFQEIRVLKDQLYKENIVLREEIGEASMFEEIVGGSPLLKAVLARVAKVAPTDSTVLITGETGTGKELIARAIHKRSHRSARPFVKVSCAAIPQSLIASELFGHEKGAFTGALHQRLGRFELAEGGTIFLDEIGELPAETQIGLLRVLQEREFERIGGNRPIPLDVRVIAATNRDLTAAIATGEFRRDLFYRVNVFPIEMPPLRERREDIPMLVKYFIDRYSRKAGKQILSISNKTLERLQSYPWPGNIRELQNVIERSVIVCDTENFSIDESWLSHDAVPTAPGRSRLSEKLAAEEKAVIEAALAQMRGRVSGPHGAAAKLGMPPSTLESKIKSLKIDKRKFRSAS